MESHILYEQNLIKLERGIKSPSNSWIGFNIYRYCVQLQVHVNTVTNYKGL
jgi:hypothetical protein